MGTVGLSGAAFVALDLVAPSTANAGPSLVCTWTNASGNRLMSAADNWSPTSDCGGTSSGAGTATLSGAQLVFPASIPTGGQNPIDDESLSIDSLVFANTYEIVTPSASGAETLTLSPTSSPAVGISVTGGDPIIGEGVTTLTIDLGDAQEWAGNFLRLQVPISGSANLQLGNGSQFAQFIVSSESPGYSGGTTVDLAEVTSNFASSLGTGPVTDSNGGHLILDNLGTPFTFANPITFDTAGEVEDARGGDTVSGNISLNLFPPEFLDDSATAAFTLQGGTISGSDARIETASDGGTVELGDTDTVGPNASGACGVAVDSGPTQLTNPAAFPTGCTLDVASGASIDLDGNSVTAGSQVFDVPGLSGDGTVTNDGTTPATLNDLGEPDSFDGTLEDGSSTLALDVGEGASLNLSGPGTYTGGTTVQDHGELFLSGSATTDSVGAGTVTVDNVGTLDLENAFGSGVLTNTLDLGNGTSGTATLLYDETTGIANWDGPVTLEGSSDIAATSFGNLLMHGVLGGTGPLVVNGGGHGGAVNLDPLSGATCTDNSYGGGTTVVGGTLVLLCPAAAASGSVTVDSGATMETRFAASGETVANDITLNGELADDSPGTVTMAGSIDLGSPGVIGASNPETFVFSNVLSGHSVTVNASGSTVDFNVSNSYTGTTTVEGGTLATEVTGALPDTPVVVDASATLDLSGNQATVSSVTGPGTVTSSLAFGLLGVNESAPDTFTGVISGSVELQQAGSSTLNLDGTAPNTYSGGTMVSSGTLEASGTATDDPFGTGDVVVRHGGGTLDLANNFGAGTITNPLQLGDGDAGSALLEQGVGSGYAYWDGPVDLDGGAGATTEIAATPFGNLQIDGVISGVGPLAVGDATNDSNVDLDPQSGGSCAANTYTAGTTVVGKLTLSCPDGAGALSSDTITMDPAATLEADLSATGGTIPNDVVMGRQIFDATAGPVTFSGAVALSGDDFVDSVGPGVDFTNALTGTGSLTLESPSQFTVVLSGTSTYDGTITLGSPTTTLNVTGSLPHAAVAVGTGATLLGTGTIGGISSNAGTVIPGSPSVPGLLQTKGPVDLGPAGGAYDVTITGPSAGTGYPFIDASSTVNLDDATLNVTDSAVVPYGTVSVIVLSSAPGTPVTGTFANDPAGTLITTAGGRTLKIGYSADAVTLTDVTGPPPSSGYQLVGADGGVFAFGSAPYDGSLPALGIHVDDIVGLAANTKGTGYFLVGTDGGVFAFGTATYEGSLPGDGIQVNNVVGIRTTTDGKGYWLVASDGGVFAFGDAKYEGSLPGDGIDVHDIVTMREASSGNDGYWLVGSDGGIFAFGSALYEGSLPGDGIAVSDIVAMVNSPDGHGYLLAGADGGMFAFGDAKYEGSLPGDGVHVTDIVSVGSDSSGLGYILVGSDGGIFAFGDLPYEGSLPGDGIVVHNIVAVHDTVPNV
ncbi:MAG TPA: autotransporter-associated beta strand repeat-containing protein [Acidimicrobiales bacterium]|jgi:autotransporter-associated beta strand protein|nr:autotransporter-associated beta strand repeat-containing protein [Acidimicrobiales bacterium]